MSIVFNKSDIETIARVLNCEPQFKTNNYRFVLVNEETKGHISLEVYPDIPIGEKTGNLISVYTPTSHLQLHSCTGYVVSEMLGEVTFISRFNNMVSGLIVDKTAGCNLYANVDAKLLSGDYTTLGPEVMLSGIALSLAENVFEAL
ncbi:MAG TPA: hypothetical protein PK843_00590 [bacterium]|nr:hypothetical protein [bacterium]